MLNIIAFVNLLQSAQANLYTIFSPNLDNPFFKREKTMINKLAFRTYFTLKFRIKFPLSTSMLNFWREKTAIIYIASYSLLNCNGIHPNLSSNLCPASNDLAKIK